MTKVQREEPAYLPPSISVLRLSWKDESINSPFLAALLLWAVDCLSFLAGLVGLHEEVKVVLIEVLLAGLTNLSWNKVVMEQGFQLV